MASAIAFNSREVSAYYAVRVPHLKQRRAAEWRGGCPIHGGTDHNFAVDPQKGFWFCHSRCGRGGDIIGLEVALMGGNWRDAVVEIEFIIGRTLLNRLASPAERRGFAERRERDLCELRAAEYFQFAVIRLAEYMLDDVLPEAVPDRYAPTQFLLKLKMAKGATLRSIYGDFRAREPRLTAALVFAGERGWRRLGVRLARFVAAGMGLPHVA